MEAVPAELTWDQVLSPNVKAIVNKLTGQTVSPGNFKETLKELNALSGPERMEFLMLQVMFRTGPT